MKKDLKNKNTSGNNSTDALQILLNLLLLFIDNFTYNVGHMVKTGLSRHRLSESLGR